MLFLILPLPVKTLACLHIEIKQERKCKMMIPIPTNIVNEFPCSKKMSFWVGKIVETRGSKERLNLGDGKQNMQLSRESWGKLCYDDSKYLQKMPLCDTN